MKKHIISLLCLSMTMLATARNHYNLIPYPSDIEKSCGHFTLKQGTTISVPNNQAYKDVLTPFIQQFKTVSGIELKYSSIENASILVDIDSSLVTEGYQLTVSKKQITISVSSPVGLFYSLCTLKQLLPVEISGVNYYKTKWTIPAVKINDAPTFSYRGIHLDVCRHFIPVKFIYKFIDLLTQYKINRFHWHLTDDQGWRIEIKQYPLLTAVGSTRPQTVVGNSEKPPFTFDGKEHKGYYTQEEIKQVVAYASQRFVTIVPEIEMPGHSMAALAAYPELGCTGGHYDVATQWGVFDDILCPKEETFTFLENVLTEVMALFPGEYIHIGGDECPKSTWEKCPLCQKLIKEKGLKNERQLQGYFTARIESFLNSKGRKIIGWDEILEGGITPNATVMSWRGNTGGIEAAKLKHQAIMSPEQPCYLDHYQQTEKDAPLAIGGYNPLKAVYDFNPLPTTLTKEDEKYIIGLQGNIWTEYMPDEKQVEYMAFPRVTAIAEVGWTLVNNKDWDSYYQRVQNEFLRYDLLDINACQLERK